MNEHHQSVLETADRRSELRARVLAEIPNSERRIEISGISTPVLEAGDGPPVVLLHGPGEFGGQWMRIIPDLMRTHRVIAPDLPGHGASQAAEDALAPDRVLAWMDALVQETCSSPPVLVGHTVGGAIAARHAVEHGRSLRGLVLVDALGLGPFEPDPAFGEALMQFAQNPTERTYDRFMRQCAFDLDQLMAEFEGWTPIASYNLLLAQTPSSMAAMNALMQGFAMSAVPAEDLDGIACPVSLIWGRHDRATNLSVAESAAERHGWPLHVIENAADDPARDRPDAFMSALRRALEETTEVEA